MNFTGRTGIKVLVVVGGVAAAGIVADWHLAASPSPVHSTKADSPPRVELVRPRRATVAQRLQTNATLEAFEETDLFAKVSGYLSDVRVDIGDHVKAGQVLAVIDVPEMKQELAEAKAQLESKRSSLESARHQLDHNKADVALQNALAKDREQLGEGRQFISDRTLDQVHANADIAKADLGVAEANRDRPAQPQGTALPRHVCGGLTGNEPAPRCAYRTHRGCRFGWRRQLRVHHHRQPHHTPRRQDGSHR